MKYLKFIFFLLFITFSSCSKNKNNESDNDFFEKSSRQEFSKALLREDFEKKQVDLKPLPFKENIIKIDKPRLLDNRNITISVTEETPLKNVLLKISNAAGIDIQIDKDIDDKINFSFYKKPIKVVLDAICKSANIRYEEQDGILIFKKDRPYIQSYFINFINSERKSTSSTSVSSNISSSSSSSNSGSSVSISSSHEDNLIQETTDGILNIINHNKQDYYEDGTNGSGSNQSVDLKQNLSINKQAGIISVNASYKTHLEIYKYLKDLKRRSSMQVLVEAKFVEVSLSDTFLGGINWNAINTNSLEGGTYTSQSLSTSTAPFSFLYKTANNSLNGTLAALSNFGKVRTIQNPRLLASHNKISTLSFTEDKVYFEVSQQATPTTTSGAVTQGSVTSVTSTAKTIPVGIVLYLIPSIDSEKNEVSLILRPTITSSTTTISDPGVQYLVASNSSANGSNISSQIPIVKTKQLEVPVTVQDGEIIILGGFIEQSSTLQEQYVPFIGRIPLLGWLFKYKTIVKNAQETVILLKVNIIKEESVDNGVDDYDRDLYNKFSNDSRPWRI